ncbi:MAG TPA: peptidase M23, partial [Flavobacteriaceae bacterium]|nr:peptidase M23 [Flavobacteriaceae bacterium]
MIKPLRNFYLLFLFVLGLIPTVHFAQTNADWTPPLDIPILLSGTFGEIRNNHFHAGLDIKTQGRQGLAVQSVKNGWINRIRISTGGYGKALYIQHYDGTTSVYAHLKKFAPKIEAYVKKKQYEKESYSIQLFPKSEELSIERGELIGYSGNTGGSFGPHLHFE